MDQRYSNTINTINLSSFNHIITPLSFLIFLSPSPLSDLVSLSDQHGLEIDIGSMDWRSVVTTWWFVDRQRQRGGLEQWWCWILFLSFWFSLSLTLILSLKLDVGFSFALNFCCGYWCQIYGGGGWWGWVHYGFMQVAIDVGGDLVAVGLWVIRFSLSDWV